MSLLIQINTLPLQWAPGPLTKARRISFALENRNAHAVYYWGGRYFFQEEVVGWLSVFKHFT